MQSKSDIVRAPRPISAAQITMGGAGERPMQSLEQTRRMSGPVAVVDAPPTRDEPSVATAPTVEVTPSRTALVGTTPVRRALPKRGRRTVGAWCFADHFGPATAPDAAALEIGPHPHIGLHTVTWLLAGEVLHRDSLGSEQMIRPGQLNLMTAGRGVAHSEESPHRGGGEVHGAQLWVAQPEATRHGAPAFEHHGELPRVELGSGEATVLVGEFGGTTSPARADTALVGLDLALHGAVVLPVDAGFEYAVVVLSGAVAVDGTVIAPGALGYLGCHREELPLSAPEPTRALLLGGVPFPEPVLTWWNFVARDRGEVHAARAA